MPVVLVGTGCPASATSRILPEDAKLSSYLYIFDIYKKQTLQVVGIKKMLPSTDVMLKTDDESTRSAEAE